VVFGSFACLFPLAFYCLVVASLNNRRRPVLVTGPADFAGVLLATAGFLIVGGPLALAGLRYAWRQTLLSGSFAAAFRSLFDTSSPWLLLWAGYFVLVVGGSLWLLWRRRTATVIYNLDAGALHKLIPDTLDRLNLPWTRSSGTYYIGFAHPADGGGLAALGPSALPVAPVARAVLEVTAAPALRNVTLHWTYGGESVRRQVEDELRHVLEGVESSENPAAGWFLSAATVLFVLLLVLLVGHRS
jgi:hypothetical protein